MLKPEIKTPWLAALRSGKYEQTMGKLHRVNKGEHSYCCLGVLCEIAVSQGVQVESEVHESFTEDEHYISYALPIENDEDVEPKEGFLSGWPPLAISIWAGDETGEYQIPVSDDSPEYVKAVVKELGLTNLISLATLNDNGLSFEQIADLIEKHL